MITRLVVSPPEPAVWDMVGGRESPEILDLAAWEKVLSSDDTPADDALAAAASDADEGLQGKQADTLACLCLLAACSHLRNMVQAKQYIPTDSAPRHAWSGLIACVALSCWPDVYS
jgi:hypothetical protein